jgi:hypothetical protein
MTAHSLRRYIKRTIGIAILSAAGLWACDWLVLQFRIHWDGSPFGSVVVRHQYAVHLKNKQIEYRHDSPAPEECVHSLFPHNDESTCWYLERHPNQVIDLDGGARRGFLDIP